jgi:hypothetical protein
MPLGQRQLFIYWRVDDAEFDTALTALRHWQAGLMAQHPGLRCALYRRSGHRQAEPTVMESYAIESMPNHPGIGDALRQQIEDGGQALLQRWLRGARHVEVFDALPA